MNEYVMALTGLVVRDAQGVRTVLRPGDLAHKDHPLVKAHPFAFGNRFNVEKPEPKPEPAKRGPGRPRK
ncbi:hypothetical protein [Saccharopolyspora shandongensis]|uniref:hypothetical protein n=1 Tax=Saccharopolyspora shandongensis TaxID=418495 RepID=UPI0033EAAF0B